MPALVCLGRPQAAPCSPGRVVDVPEAPGDEGTPVTLSSRCSSTLTVRSAKPLAGDKRGWGGLKRAAKPDPGKAAVPAEALMEEEVLVAMVTGDVNPAGCVLARGGMCPCSAAVPQPCELRAGLWELSSEPGSCQRL